MALLSCSVMFSSGERCVFYAVGLSFLRVLMLGCSFLRLRLNLRKGCAIGCSFLRLRLNLRKGCAIISTSLFHRLLIITPFLDFRFLVMLL